MNRQRSLRMRILLGSMLWGAGLLAVAHLISMALFHHFPQLRRVGVGTLVVIAVACIAAGFAQVGRGITPLDKLRERLNAVREGHAKRLEGSYPSEVQPLVSDLNALLEERERSLARAQAKAGDLAHGLKTPLAVLAQEAERAASGGQAELAATIEQQVERMRKQVEYHLAHARGGAALHAQARVLASAEGLARTLQRLHAARSLAIEVNVPPDHVFRGQSEDLEEMLGNLLDNACKWARSRVTLRSARADGMVILTIDDDGPGLEPSMRERVLQRGVRADEAEPGSGFGLAIVRDLAQVYGGSIALDDSPAGGLRARLRLPAATSETGSGG